MSDDAEYICPRLSDELGVASFFLFDIVAPSAVKRRGSRLCKKLSESTIGCTERAGFLEMESDHAHSLGGVNQRYRQICLHVGELPESLERPRVLLAKLFGGFNGNHLALAQGVYDGDLAIAPEIGELRVELRGEPASSEDLEAIALDRYDHTTCRFYNLDALSQKHSRNVLDGPRIRERSRYVEQLPCQRRNALNFLFETLKLRGRVRDG